MHWCDYISTTIEATRAIRLEPVYELARQLQTTWREGYTVFTCGNGGSASNASHLAQDLSKGASAGRRPQLRAICLCDSVPSLTAWANDSGYAEVFSGQLNVLGRPRDLLIAISGSGNSENVIRAVNAAHARDMSTWGITGFSGGKLGELAQNHLNVPSGAMGQVEAIHGILFHWLIEVLFRAGPRGELEGPQ